MVLRGTGLASCFRFLCELAGLVLNLVRWLGGLLVIRVCYSVNSYSRAILELFETVKGLLIVLNFSKIVLLI